MGLLRQWRFWGIGVIAQWQMFIAVVLHDGVPVRRIDDFRFHQQTDSVATLD